VAKEKEREDEGGGGGGGGGGLRSESVHHFLDGLTAAEQQQIRV